MMDTRTTTRKTPDATEQLRREVQALGPWFHNLHLPGGVQTAPDHFLQGDFPRFKWLQIAPHIPEDLRGWRVLDVGCNAGFYSFELARRGASVLAIDHDPHYLTQARWAAGQLGLADRVEFRQEGVWEVGARGESFDLVWFMGVFYHLRYPLLALDLLARCTRRLLMFQTLTVPSDTVYEDTADHPIHEREPLLDPGWPRMAFIEHRFAGDPTNWWVANHAGCEAMLRSAGLRVLTRPAEEMWLCEPQQADWDGRKQLDEVLGALGGGRPRSAPTTSVRPELVEGLAPTTSVRPELVEGPAPTTSVRPELVKGPAPTTSVRPELVEGLAPTTSVRPELVEGLAPTTSVRPELVEGPAPTTSVRPELVEGPAPTTSVRPELVEGLERGASTSSARTDARGASTSPARTEAGPARTESPTHSEPR